MLKKVIFAIAPMLMVVSSAMAEDNLLSGLDVSSINDAQIEIEDVSLDIDMDALADEAGDADEAIEACFRRFGYYGGYRGYGYGHFGCYRPYYTYRAYTYPSYFCYRPVYTYVTYAPIYRHYWGCY